MDAIDFIFLWLTLSFIHAVLTKYFTPMQIIEILSIITFLSIISRCAKSIELTEKHVQRLGELVNHIRRLNE